MRTWMPPGGGLTSRPSRRQAERSLRGLGVTSSGSSAQAAIACPSHERAPRVQHLQRAGYRVLAPRARSVSRPVESAPLGAA